MTLATSNPSTIVNVCAFERTGSFFLSHLETQHSCITGCEYAEVHSLEACVSVMASLKGSVDWGYRVYDFSCQPLPVRQG